MDFKLFSKVFGAVFVAELGDKTQLATVLFSADRPASRWTVFAASAAALVLSALMGVFAGGVLGQHVAPQTLRWAAGSGFIAIGVWTLLRA